MPPLEQGVFAALAERLGFKGLSNRLIMQVEHTSKLYGGMGLARLHPENSEAFNHLVRLILKYSGLLGRGTRNCIDYRVTRLEARLPKLPDPFDGFTLLHLTDLHADAIPDGGQRLTRLIGKLDFDICLITGDFRFLTWGDYHPALEHCAAIIQACKRSHRPLAVLGNHDFIEMTPGLEHLGLSVLLNESSSLSKGGESLWFLGVDDPHFYGTHDLERAARGVPKQACRILLSHSPELYEQASTAGVDLFLCGHTHGGQICLPGGIAVMTNAACPKPFTSGPWRQGEMLGYTARGAGASGCTARFFCPPELALITLRKTSSGPAVVIDTQKP